MTRPIHRQAPAAGLFAVLSVIAAWGMAHVGNAPHRTEESTLRQEIEAAGFEPVSEADFLRNPENPRDAVVFHPRIPNDEFVLKFQKLS